MSNMVSFNLRGVTKSVKFYELHTYHIYLPNKLVNILSQSVALYYYLHKFLKADLWDIQAIAIITFLLFCKVN